MGLFSKSIPTIVLKFFKMRILNFIFYKWKTKIRNNVFCGICKTADPNDDKMKLVQIVKDIVPEFRSQNSVFIAFDK